MDRASAEIKAATVEAAAFEDELAAAERRLQQLSLSQPAASGGQRQEATFQGYYHPKHAGLLVTPGTLVVLLQMLLVQFKHRYCPGSSSLRTNPPRQQDLSLEIYGQRFLQAAELRGYEDPASTHIGYYLQGLRDQELRTLYHGELLAGGKAPATTLEEVIQRVEALAATQLQQLALEANLAVLAALSRFEDKQRLLSGTAEADTSGSTRGARSSAAAAGAQQAAGGGGAA
jgi:hypothetical protein